MAGSTVAGSPGADHDRKAMEDGNEVVGETLDVRVSGDVAGSLRIAQGIR